MPNIPTHAIEACKKYFGLIDILFVSKKEMYYSWKVSGDLAIIRISDYLDGAPEHVLVDFCDMVCLRALRRKWVVPDSYLEYIRSDDFILRNRPTYIRRSKNLLRTSVGEHHDLMDSVQRLLDMGLLGESDIENSYMSWTRRENYRRVGFCSTLFRVVGISSRLDGPDVPDFVRDYVVYHECLHLRQGYRPGNRTHDSQFRAWEHSFPRWEEAERILSGLNASTS